MRRADFKKLDYVWTSWENIDSVWVFGSSRDGTLSPGSDLDFAILFVVPPDIDELAEIRALIQESLCIDEVDLLSLNSAGSLVGFEAVSGKSLYCRDKSRRAEFVSYVARQYEDDMAFLARGMADRKLAVAGE